MKRKSGLEVEEMKRSERGKENKSFSKSRERPRASLSLSQINSPLSQLLLYLAQYTRRISTMSRPPMNLIFPDRSAAGISSNQDGQRVIASTRRPDGTYALTLPLCSTIPPLAYSRLPPYSVDFDPRLKFDQATHLKRTSHCSDQLNRRSWISTKQRKELYRD